MFPTAKSCFYVGSDVAAWYANKGFTTQAQVVLDNEDVTSATPKESDFTNFEFRLLSATTVGKDGYNCTEFSPEVLKKAIGLFEGKPAYANHSTYVGKAIGNIVNAKFEKSFTDAKTGLIIPPGINVDFKISAVRQPELVYDLQSTPSPIQSCSAGVEYTWKPSHEFQDSFDFYWHLGEEISINGKKEVVRMVAIELLEVSEGSLVWMGADPYAKRKMIDETGQQWLENIQKSGIVNYAQVAEFSKKIEAMGKRFHIGNFYDNKTTATNTFSQSTKKDDDTVALETKLSETTQGLEKKTSELQEVTKDLTTQKALVADLQKQLETFKLDAKLGQEIKAEKVAYAKSIYSLSVGANVNEATLQLIEKSSFSELDGLIESWGGRAMKFYGQPVCKKCGHTEFVTRSSKLMDKNKTSETDNDSDTHLDSLR